MRDFGSTIRGSGGALAVWSTANSPLNRLLQNDRVHWLGEVLGVADFGAAADVGFAAVAAQCNGLQMGEALPQAGHQVISRAIRESQIGNKEVKCRPCGQLNRFLNATGALDLVPLKRQERGDRLA